MTGWTNPKTKRATAFYCLLGVLCSNIYQNGLHEWEFLALVLMTGIGTVSSVLYFLNHRKDTRTDPPGGKG